ncbi:MAG: glycosyl hydrolase [Novosphingobium sp. SCN 63-17]|uniref:glycoside hydrolase family 127 protein n=1 Tax=unclassified Novosphingobium TaxID=2644732 RepID=UPI00086A041D|nr:MULTISPECIES: glycoside hydrolase family 127 protein [unclassified Novosphingobium]ODU83282.1 MAG: glycosyl hydrolase [Novosphingobium sp. SCN 63-17]OJX96449.1 MAG: glycosyl hydrolase [Novosphingobium sp. 63-713]
MTHPTCCTGHSRREILASAATSAIALGLLPAGAGAVTKSVLPAFGKARLRPFDLADVELGESPFLHAQRMTEAYLLRLQPDRMLHNFRVNAGLPPKAHAYGGWESEPMWQDIHCQGHTLGHYLSACSLAWRSTRDVRFRQRVDHIAAELAECQKASGTGLVCAFPEGAGLVAAHLRGEKITGVPWYTLHKVFAGLRDAALLADSTLSRDVLIRLADWAVIATRPLSDGQFEAMLDTEHGGMNEVLADLYFMTGKEDYRLLARRFSHKAILTPLAAGHDQLDGLHANTQIPKIVGFERVYEATGDETYRDAAQFFWKTVVNNRSFATGGHGDNEHFFPTAQFDKHVFSAKGSETCGQHNMLKLTRALFLNDPSVDYADFYERTLYNGILASQDPDSGMVTYFQGARPGYMKLYHSPEDSFWCCTGTGMENHVKYRDSIYFHDGRTLYVNLFIPSALHWREQDAQLVQTTNFPESSVTHLRWKLTRPADLTLKLRHPGWSRTAAVLVNGKQVALSATPGRYVEIARTWRDGDEVELRLIMEHGTQSAPTAPDIVAFTYGPLVLAGALGGEGLAPGADIIVNERKYGEYNDTAFAAPAISGPAETLPQRISPGAGPLEFTIASTRQQPLRLIPYYRIAHERYATYWRLG